MFVETRLLQETDGPKAVAFRLFHGAALAVKFSSEEDRARIPSQGEGEVSAHRAAP